MRMILWLFFVEKKMRLLYSKFEAGKVKGDPNKGIKILSVANKAKQLLFGRKIKSSVCWCNKRSELSKN